MNERQYVTAYERAARITYLLCDVGIAMTTSEVANEIKLARNTAWEMLCAISRVVPIYQDDHEIWRKCE